MTNHRPEVRWIMNHESDIITTWHLKPDTVNRSDICTTLTVTPIHLRSQADVERISGWAVHIPRLRVEPNIASDDRSSEVVSFLGIVTPRGTRQYLKSHINWKNCACVRQHVSSIDLLHIYNYVSNHRPCNIQDRTLSRPLSWYVFHTVLSRLYLK